MTVSPKTKPPVLFARTDQDLAERAQRIADREYEGNVSMVVRIAVRRFVTELEASQQSQEAVAA